MNRNAFSRPRRLWLASVVASLAIAAWTLGAQQASDPQTVVNNAYNQFKALKEGKNADYIPALAKVDPNLFESPGDGGRQGHTAGDIKTEVSIQSIRRSSRWRRSSRNGARRDREADRRRCDRRAVQPIIAVEAAAHGRRTGARNNRSSIWSHLGDQRGDGANADAVWKKIIGTTTITRARSWDVTTSRNPIPTRNRRSARSCSPTDISRATGRRRSISTRVSARSASTPRTWR